MRIQPAARHNSVPQGTRLALAALAACLLYLLYGILTYALAPSPSETGAFSLLGSWRIPAFYDLHWNLVVTSCDIPITELATKNIKCDGFPWVGYPPLSLIIGKAVGLGVKDRSWIAALSSLALIITLCHQVWLATNTTRSWAMLTTAVLLAFPVQLLIERNNLDAVIYVILALFCIVVWLPEALACLAAGAVGLILTAFKIYPFFGVTAWAATCLWNPNLRRNRRWLAALLFLSQIAVLIAVLSSLQSNMLVKAGGLGSHGLLALGYVNMPLINSIGIDQARLLIKLLFAAKAIALLMGFLLPLLLIKPEDLTLSTRHQHSAQSRQYAYSTLIVMTATAIGCYITTINFDYRLVFLAPFLVTIATICLGNSRPTPRATFLLRTVLISGGYIAYLPLFHVTNNLLAFASELLDEMVMAPYFFGGCSALLLLLAGRDLGLNHGALRSLQERC